MEIERNILNNLLFDDHFPENVYETEYYKELDQKVEAYRDEFMEVLPVELKGAYRAVCDIEDHMRFTELDKGKVIGIAIASALIKTLENLPETFGYVTKSWIPIKEVLKMEDEDFKKSINEYKERESENKCS